MSLQRVVVARQRRELGFACGHRFDAPPIPLQRRLQRTFVGQLLSDLAVEAFDLRLQFLHAVALGNFRRRQRLAPATAARVRIGFLTRLVLEVRDQVLRSNHVGMLRRQPDFERPQVGNRLFELRADRHVRSGRGGCGSRGARRRVADELLRLQIGELPRHQHAAIAVAIQRIVQRLDLQLHVLHRLHVRLQLVRQLVAVSEAIGLQPLLLFHETAPRVFQLAPEK